MLLVLLLASGPVLGPQKAFGDWAVACDNVQRCEMTSLFPEQIEEGARWPEMDVSVVREPLSSPVITFDVKGKYRGRVAILVDGKRIGDGVPRNGRMTLSGTAAVAVMAVGKRLTMKDAAGRVIGEASLTGASAALRFIDAGQRLAGTRAALIAKGSEPVARTPRPMPVIRFIRPPNGAPPAITPALRAAMAGIWSCDLDPVQVARNTGNFRLDARVNLVLLPCGWGPYNTDVYVFVVTAGRPSLATLDLPFAQDEEGVPILPNARFDPRTGRLSGSVKGRGVSDCGSSRRFVWDGAMFRLVEAKTLDPCRGSMNWLTIWRAEARPR